MPRFHRIPATPPLQLLFVFPFMTSRLAARSTLSSAMSAFSADRSHLQPRRFAPLDPARVSDAPPLKGIVFDVDGTLW